ncbi:MAG: LysM peptidoglycan-binding domain-containing protein [Ruminococcaceae bacterium]|nr:LysM peptidoglycan-binding domain-containing protein [Oscillospiraceae bacterium]
MTRLEKREQKKLVKHCGAYQIRCNTADLSHKVKRKTDAKRVVGWMNSIPGYFLLFIMTLSIAASGMYGAGFRVGYKVYAGNEQIGTITQEETFNKALDEVHSTLEENFGEDFTLQEEPYVKRGLVNVKEETKNLSEEMISSAGEISEGILIKVNGVTAAIVADEQTARQVLDSLLAQKRQEYANDTAEFAGDITLEQQYVQTTSIQDGSAAEQILNGESETAGTYLIKSGDTLSVIAEKHGMTIDHLRSMNPDLDGDVVIAGQELIISQPQNWLSVRTEETITYEEEIPFETKEEFTDELYLEQVEVSQEGENGTKTVEALLIKVDGQEVETQVLKEEVTKEPVAKIERHGTKERPRDVATGKFIRPTGGYLSSGFGARWGTVHQGMDLANTLGSPIVASDGGKVTYSTFNTGGYGYLVIIDHENGYQTYYAHCSKLLVNVGDRVAQGDQIALIGSTGNSTGPHCHFEIRLNGVPQNPAGYVTL